MAWLAGHESEITKITDLSGDRNTAYWVTIAQIIPVLALALVLETRALARRWKRKKNYDGSRRTRAVWALALLIAVTAMGWQLPTALFNIAEGESTILQVLVSSVIMSLLLLIVVTIPISGIISIAVMDTIGPWVTGLPWSRESRLVRRVGRESERVETLIRRLRWRRIDVLETLLMILQIDILTDTVDPKTREHSEGKAFVKVSNADSLAALGDVTADLRELEDILLSLKGIGAEASKKNLPPEKLEGLRRELGELSAA